MLTISDLAARWGVTVNQVKQFVKSERIPFIALKTSPLGASRICWKFVRFQEADVAEWESKRKKIGHAASGVKPIRVPLTRPMLKRSPPSTRK